MVLKQTPLNSSSPGLPVGPAPATPIVSASGCSWGRVALLSRFAVSKMCHCWSALGQAVPMEDRLTTRTACPKADKLWHVPFDRLINQSNPAASEN